MEPAGVDYAADLDGLDADQVRKYLGDHSGLPGPRGNLTLMAAAGDVLPSELALELVEEDDEYLACCGVMAVGRLVVANPDDSELTKLLTESAADWRWRVREAAATAVQRIGDRDPARMRQLVADWVGDSDPLVIRAGIAAICEPRLLADPITAAAALDACTKATQALAQVPRELRAYERVGVLRQGLGYCWSVAVAGSPEAGLPRFAALDVSDPDIAQIVKQNRGKQRLKRLLEAN